eukprot:scaffold25883_cov134-Skeletonema_marinoi.AAC.4
MQWHKRFVFTLPRKAACISTSEWTWLQRNGPTKSSTYLGCAKMLHEISREEVFTNLTFNFQRAERLCLCYVEDGRWVER